MQTAPIYPLAKSPLAYSIRQVENRRSNRTPTRSDPLGHTMVQP